MRNRIAKILQEAIQGKELVSSETMSTISGAIAEYGHMMNGERYTLGELAGKIRTNLSGTDHITQIVDILERYADKYPEDMIADNESPEQTYYDRYAVMPPEWAPKFAVTGQDPPKSATS
jgi:hypothetical protein